MQQKIKFDIILLVIIAIPVIGYGIMHGLAFVIPLSEGQEGESIGPIFYNMILIILGLLIPYVMLKLLFKAAHMRNPQEKEFHIEDLPKDKEQLAHKLDAQKNA